MICKDMNRQICHAAYYAGGTHVCAQLSALSVGLTEQYSITLEQTDQTACCALGDDLEMARRIFLAVVYGGVTACTLSDVVEDYLGDAFLH